MKCTGCSIIEPAEEGITIHQDEQEPAKQSLFNDVKISAGVTIVGSYAKPQFTACEAFESGFGFNICKDSAAVLEQCKSYNNLSGFGIFGKGCTLIDCEAYQIDALGFSIAGASATVFERCKAHDCFCGFDVSNKCSLTFRNCEAYGNNQKGFEVESGCECTFTDCKSNGKAFTKTTGLMGLKI